MTHERDIDRLLDLWLIDGPTEVADRVILDVADRIDRQPQRPAWRFLRRPTLMTSSARWAAVLVAIALIAVVGFAVFGRTSDSAVGGKPTPTMQTSPDATDGLAPPLGRFGWWIGTPRQDPSFGPNHDRAWLRLSSSPSGEYLDVVGSDGALTPRTAAVYDPVSFPAPGRLVVRAETAEDSCATGDVGTYDWEISPGGNVFTITLVDDDCAVRALILPGAWIHGDCPGDGGYCLGDLEAGTYRSSAFEPFGGLETTKLGYGQLAYTVPVGWANTNDGHDFYELRPQVGSTRNGIFMNSVSAIALPDEACGTVPSLADPSVERTPDAMAEALSGRSGLVVSNRQPVTIGGYPGVRLDLAQASGWACYPDVGPLPGVPLLAHVGPNGPPGYYLAIGPTERMRVYFVNLGNNVVMANIEAQDDAAFQKLLPEATEIVENIEFDR